MRFLLPLIMLLLGVSSLHAEQNLSKTIEMKNGVAHYEGKPVGLIGNENPAHYGSMSSRTLRNMSDVLAQNYYTTFELIGKDNPLINGTYRNINGTLVNMNSTFDFLNDTHVKIENRTWDLKTIFPNLPEEHHNETSSSGNKTDFGARCLFFKWPIVKKKVYRKHRHGGCNCECCRNHNKATVQTQGTITNLAIPTNWIQTGQIKTITIETNSIPNKMIQAGSIQTIPSNSIPNKIIQTGSVKIQTIPSKSIPNKIIQTGSVKTQTIPSNSIPNKVIQAGSVKIQTIPSKSIPNKIIQTGSVKTQTIPSKSIPNKIIQTGSVKIQTIPSKSIPNKIIQTGSVKTQTIPSNSIPNKMTHQPRIKPQTGSLEPRKICLMFKFLTRADKPLEKHRRHILYAFIDFMKLDKYRSVWLSFSNNYKIDGEFKNMLLDKLLLMGRYPCETMQGNCCELKKAASINILNAFVSFLRNQININLKEIVAIFVEFRTQKIMKNHPELAADAHSVENDMHAKDIQTTSTVQKYQQECEKVA